MTAVCAFCTRGRKQLRKDLHLHRLILKSKKQEIACGIIQKNVLEIVGNELNNLQKGKGYYLCF